MGESVHDKKHPDQKTDFVFEWVEKKAIANRKPRKCPKCDGVKVASIMYGLPAPNPRLEQELKEGKTVLGGCVINTDHDPTWQCIDCGAQIFKGGNSRH